ncbi:uncharacterized protein LOC131166290 [Malania oleifera]|uniref:uncharacterized protein LOC131166290 n=1 Tax=Malania oleifera TaxID=397392 RepID=UPI0025AEA0C9|nr:uncharacterized protein LOC131166290 [Malania oleifera]
MSAKAPPPPETCPPKLIVLNGALKLAEQWVDNMSGTLDEGSHEVELEGRPSRLGLGATATRQYNLGPLNDPVERKLRAKLNAGKRKAAESTEISKPFSSSGNGCGADDDDDDEDLESRTCAFSRKRVVSQVPSLQGKKKLK